MIVVSGVFYTSLITTNTVAQIAINMSYPAPAALNTTELAEVQKTAIKKSIDPIDKTALKEMKSRVKAAKANIKAIDNLNKNFKTATDIQWAAEEKVIVAIFKINDKSARIVYDSRGNWLYTVITYQEDQLPRDIRSLVNAAYKDFTISLVQEIRQGIITVYKVHLENCNRMKQILVHDGEITVYEEYAKSK